MTSQNAGTISSVAPPIGKKIRTPVIIPSTPVQRTISPTRIALTNVMIIPAASANPAARSR